MQIFKDKVKLKNIEQKWLIIDSTLDFNKRLKMQSLNKKY